MIGNVSYCSLKVDATFLLFSERNIRGVFIQPKNGRERLNKHITLVQMCMYSRIPNFQ